MSETPTDIMTATIANGKSISGADGNGRVPEIESLVGSHPPDLERVELEAPLDGFWVEVDCNEINMGFIEDAQQGIGPAMLDQLAIAIVRSNLPHGHTREGLRMLPVRHALVLLPPIISLVQVPKVA